RQPFYTIAVANKRRARNSGNRFEDVGWWDPNKATPCLAPRYWLTAGAVPTPKVRLLLGRVGLVPLPPKPPVTPVRTHDDFVKWQSQLKK
ncbi:hypothetical protein QJQ45_025568, partial [Haematococcus lacustris]